MALPPFLLGLTIGLIIAFWKQYEVNSQIKKILSSLSQFEQIKSLSTISLVRRTIKIFNREYQALQSELETHQYLLENCPIGYLKIDEENQLIWCNQEARKLLKIERWQPNKLRLFLELVISFKLDQLIQQTRKTQRQLTLEWDFYPNDDSSSQQNTLDYNKNYSIFLKAYSYPLAEGKIAIFIENKQPLKILSKSRNRIFSDLSHELRTPLTSISLLTEALLKRTENQEKKWVEQINKEIHRLIDLVQNWLDLSKIEEYPYQNLQYQSLHLKQLIISAWQSLEALAKQKNINFNYTGENNIHIEADLNRLIQVFVNLFDNGIKHSDENGEIQVNVNLITAESNLIEINIIDSGTGFNSEDLPHVFERLYRGDKSRVRKSRQGSGLGLAIVKEIIEAHHGSITAQNHPKTGSAWLKITLPQKGAFNSN
jgi:two-component system phosphate regulon sensor histidine kinase PhoR